MANMPGGSYGTRGKPDNDVYTVLVIVGCCVVGLALGYVIYKSIDLLGAIPSFQM